MPDLDDPRGHPEHYVNIRSREQGQELLPHCLVLLALVQDQGGAEQGIQVVVGVQEAPITQVPTLEDLLRKGTIRDNDVWGLLDRGHE